GTARQGHLLHGRRRVGEVAVRGGIDRRNRPERAPPAARLRHPLVPGDEPPGGPGIAPGTRAPRRLRASVVPGGEVVPLSLDRPPMSDNWIRLIPQDPRFVPEPERRVRAKDRIAEIAPDADEIEITVSETVEFFDCGGNHERILCPSCGVEIPTEWWQERM